MATPTQERNGPYVHIDYSFHLSGETKFAFTFDDNDSIGSSVKSGLRNSLHSSYDFTDLGEDLCPSDYSDENSFGDHEEVPSWRLDPEESNSDWKIVIESVPDGAITEYDVHKCILVEGIKKSDSFVSLFNLSAEEMVGVEGFSVYKVHSGAARLIPDVLDYLYSIHDILKISTETAVGLRHLSQFFGIRSLATEVISFIYKDMDIENMKSYLLAATLFDDLPTQKLCAQRCAEHIKAINPFSDLLAEMDPSFLLDIISCPKTDRKRCSRHLSKLVSVYCNLHKEFIDQNVFEELTAVEYLPLVSEDSALPLLILETRLVADARDEKQCLTNLQRRCIASLLPLIQSNECTDEKERKRRSQVMKKLPNKVLLDLLSRSLCIP
jgi:hypothetical protein